MQTIAQLQEFALSPHISIDDSLPDFPIIEVSNENATARIALHGAHILSYTPQRQQPVIFTSKQAIYRAGKAIRGGIPICWPWFSAHPTDPSQPSHGYARISYWKLTHSESNNDLSTLRFSLTHESLHAELQISIGASLKVALTTTNTGTSEVTIGGALHSYFLVSDIGNIAISGLDQIHYSDTLTNTEEIQSGEIRISEEIDRVYHDTTETVTLYDAQWNRSIVVEKSGSHSTVIWNPWKENAHSMADLGDDEYRKFVCIEAANAHADTYPLSPGSSHTLSTTITST